MQSAPIEARNGTESTLILTIHPQHQMAEHLPTQTVNYSELHKIAKELHKIAQDCKRIWTSYLH